MNELQKSLRRAADGPRPRFNSADIERRVRRRRTARCAIGGGAVAAVVVGAGFLAAVGNGGRDTPIADDNGVDPSGAAYCDVLSRDPWAQLNDGDPFDVIVFVEPSTPANQVDALGRRIAEDPVVTSSTFVDQDEAFEDYADLFADAPEMLAAVQLDQVPPSFRVDLIGDELDLHRWTQQFDDEPGVLRVVTIESTFPNGARLIDNPVARLATGAGEPVFVTGVSAEDLAALVSEAPKELESDAEVLHAAIEAGATGTASLVVLTPEIADSATRILDWFEAECRGGD